MTSAPDIAARRLDVMNAIEPESRNIINPDEVVTWVDLNGTEEMAGPSSWYNDLEAKACARICYEMKPLYLRESNPPWVAVHALDKLSLRIGGGVKVKILEALRDGKTIVTTSIGAQEL